MYNNFPLILQQKHNDCGIACIKMICKYYLVNFEDKVVLDYINFTSNGISIKDIRNVLNKLGFQSLAICLPGNKISPDLTLPSIACIKLGNKDLYHYVVIYEIENNNISYADPSNGFMKENSYDFNINFTGELILILK